jgi:uncharacterized repeat protein (TIGR03806 family)
MIPSLIKVLILIFIVSCSETAKPNLNPQEIKILSNLSEYGLFASQGESLLVPKIESFKYDLNTPLFSDYTDKDRVIFLPEDTQMQYHSEKEFDFPVGSIIAKTFSLSRELSRVDNKPGRRLETRLLIHQPKGWFAVSYVWDGEDKDAHIAYAGENIPLVHKTEDSQKKFTYAVPSRNQCTSCHQSYEGRTQSIVPIGIKAKHLNKEYTFKNTISSSDPVEMNENQLELMKKKGMLAGLPFFGIPKNADYNNEDESVNDRARAYLDINCAHCHNKNAAGGMNSKLILSSDETDISSLGACKSPGSAGKGGGGLRYDIVPGHADQSILVYRTETTEPGAMMPQIGRALTHTEGIELLKKWINHMDKIDCP